MLSSGSAILRASQKKLPSLHVQSAHVTTSAVEAIKNRCSTYPCDTRAKAHGVKDLLSSLLEYTFGMTRRLLIDPKLGVFSNFDRKQVQDVGLSVESGDLHGKTPFDSRQFAPQDALEFVMRDSRYSMADQLYVIGSNDQETDASIGFWVWELATESSTKVKYARVDVCGKSISVLDTEGEGRRNRHTSLKYGSNLVGE